VKVLYSAEPDAVPVGDLTINVAEQVYSLTEKVGRFLSLVGSDINFRNYCRPLSYTAREG
jgi:hypothetical protein